MENLKKCPLAQHAIRQMSGTKLNYRLPQARYLEPTRFSDNLLHQRGRLKAKLHQFDIHISNLAASGKANGNPNESTMSQLTVTRCP